MACLHTWTSTIKSSILTSTTSWAGTPVCEADGIITHNLRTLKVLDGLNIELKTRVDPVSKPFFPHVCPLKKWRKALGSSCRRHSRKAWSKFVTAENQHLVRRNCASEHETCQKRSQEMRSTPNFKGFCEAFP